MYKINYMQQYVDDGSCSLKSYDPALINTKLHWTPRLVDQRLTHRDFEELAILQKQIKFAKALELYKFENMVTSIDKNINNITTDNRNCLETENTKRNEECKVKKITETPMRPNADTPKFVFGDNNCNVIKDKFVDLSNNIRFDFNNDVDSINTEHCLEPIANLDSIHEFYHDNKSKKDLENPKRTFENKASLSRVRSKQRSIREDVMNKNILRAIRREWKTLFNSFWASNNIKLKKQSDQYLSLMKNFAHYLVEKSRTSTEKDSFLLEVWDSTVYSPEVNDFVVYLGIFTDYWTMKKVLEESIHLSKLNKINGVLYTFTQTKFYELISTIEVNAIIQLVWKITDLTNLVCKNCALVEHQDEYIEHIENLFIHQEKCNEDD